MPKLKLEVEVSKEAYELSTGVKNCILSIRKALKDGWQPGQDMPVIFQAVIADLVPAVQGIDSLSLESKEDLSAFIKAFSLPVQDLAAELLKK